MSKQSETPQSATQTVDLTNCDREPIHVPAAIQPHGVLFALQEPGLTVQQVSDNCNALLGVNPTDLLGNPIAKVLGDEQQSSLRETLQQHDFRAINPIKLKVSQSGGDRIVNGIVHRNQGVLFLELEPAGDPLEAPLKAFQSFQAAMAKVQKATSLAQLWRVVVQEVKTILGYDRVMIYKFDRDGNGEVIEEAVIERKDSYLGLHYPASDIPQQARVLYTINCIRHIPDVGYTKSGLVPLIYPPSRELTDMSLCTLRSVSPLHVEYLQNMGVAASISISLLSGSSLWGLIACHNYTPKFVPFEMRSACEMLGQVVSLRMASLENAELTRYKSRTNAIQAKFLEELAKKILRDALVEGKPSLLDYVPCGGAILWHGKECATVGETPTVEQIEKIVRRIRRNSSPVFVTDHLSSIFAEAKEFKEVASGVLAVTISREKNIYLMWVRPEQTQTVRWGGEPTVKVVDAKDPMRLHPRKSFDLWKEVVEEKSAAWTDVEVESATELRSTVMGLLLQR